MIAFSSDKNCVLNIPPSAVPFSLFTKVPKITMCIPAISKEKMVEMPDYCVKEYNELYKSFNEEFLNLLIKNDGKFHMTMNYKEGTFNIDFDFIEIACLTNLVFLTG